MSIWALIPARGGSKSIKYKNLVPLGGRPLMEYGVTAAKKSGLFDRIICSTEDKKIADFATQDLGIEVDIRPLSLARDDTPVIDVATEILNKYGKENFPEFLFLVQPTSPFLLVEHIQLLLDCMRRNPSAASGQTVCKCPHNHHAWNQRVLDGECVSFEFRDERKHAYNKQRKKQFYVFGNLVAIRPQYVGEMAFFSEPSVAVEIEQPYDFDVDNELDLCIANGILQSNVLDLPHM